MIKQLDITGVHVDTTKNLKRYVSKKIAGLDKYIPRHARKSVQVEVKLKEVTASDKQQCQCEVVMSLPGETIVASETTGNMHAAIDIVEQKLKNQIRAYKEKNAPQRRRVLTRGIFGRMRSRS
jgi:putative sigma-54 modulation protein